ncbi:MAG: hypothetical protein RJP96_14870 [Algiphilus sp.]|uniref:hypothetical protein n=1 Tax=Algiphilus sp. TaxID=1872431 RepID=UPI0032ECDB68
MSGHSSGSRPATEKQRNYARSLGLSFPDDISVKDMSALLDTRLNKDKPAKSTHKRMADAFGVAYSEYTGKRALFEAIFEAADDKGPADLCRWFAFRVCRDIEKTNGRPMSASLHSPSLSAVAEQMADNPAVIDSIHDAAETDPFIWWGTFTAPNGRVLQGGSRGTLAYSEAKRLLEDAGLAGANATQSTGPKTSLPKPARSGYTKHDPLRVAQARQQARTRDSEKKPRTAMSAQTRDRLLIAGLVAAGLALILIAPLFR